MQKRQLGTSDLFVTPIGFGAWAIGGGGWMFGWGPQDEAESIQTIQRAVEAGVNWIDTAAVYGLGHSEEVVGRAVQAIPMADRPYVFTKCSLAWDESRTISEYCGCSVSTGAICPIRRSCSTSKFDTPT